MLRIGICDDIREEVEKQEKQVRQITYQMGIRTDIRKCYSGMDLLMEIELSGQFDIIFLDIELGGINGIETARQIRESDVNCNIIFITSFEQYSKEAISVHPFAFVDKPDAYAQMKKIIIDAYDKLQIDDKFAFKFNKTYYNISLNKIMCFMSEKRIINIYCIDKICTFYGKMNDVEVNLKKKQADFWRIHHSFLVNPRYIEEYHYDKIVLQNGISLEISRAKRENIRLMYMRKLGK